MTKSNRVFAFFLAGMLGLGCGGSGLETAGDAGPGGSEGFGGALGSGGSGPGGAGSGGAVAGGGAGGSQTSGGSAAGGVIGSGGRAGGTGGSNPGGSGGTAKMGGRGGTNSGGARTGGVSGAGGTTCPPVACPAIACLHGELPNPDPCACPICAPPDAGIDGIVCGPCPMIKCQYPGEPGVDACGCPTCPPPPDAGRDAGKLACVDLDECACFEANGCGVVSEACYCPFPQCSSSGACVCGGGKFIGCAPVALTTCTAAKARVAALCPEFRGSPFDTLCAPSDTGCVTKCLNQVTACSDMSCYTCVECKCKPDPFTTCLDQCARALAQ